VTAPPTVLVTGARGQVGREVEEAFTRAGWQVTAAGHRELDVTDGEAVAAVLHGLRPTAVVNAAAWTDVDACEADPDRALRVNALGVRHLARASAAAGSFLCHLSTDHVFDGTRAAPYTEDDEPHPLSAYGRSKWAGEREAGPGACVVRTSWVCGRHGPNTVATILGLAADPARSLAFVDDQRGCLTVASDLAAMVLRLVADRRPGLHHVTNQGPASWYEIARRVLEAAGHDPDRVRPVATAELDPPRAAPRPANGVLDNAVLRRDGIPLLPPVEEALPALVALIEAGPGRAAQRR
jgi:dTDP-4-dehydrorhamnose reductase